MSHRTCITTLVHKQEPRNLSVGNLMFSPSVLFIRSFVFLYVVFFSFPKFVFFSFFASHFFSRFFFSLHFSFLFSFLYLTHLWIGHCISLSLYLFVCFFQKLHLSVLSILISSCLLILYSLKLSSHLFRAFTTQSPSNVHLLLSTTITNTLAVLMR